MPPAKTKLDIIIVGGGIGGMTIATFLKQDGHTVTVLERQSENGQSHLAGGMGLFYNSQRLWQQRGLWEKVSSVADPAALTRTFSHKGGNIACIKSSMGIANVHRADLLKILCKIAIEHGVDVRFSTEIKSLKDVQGQPSLVLENGDVLKADLIIGADGINSFVRAQLYPEIKPSLQHSVILLVNVPPEVMKQTESTENLWNDDPLHHTIGPTREIVSWAMRKHNPPCYHLNFCDHDYMHNDSDLYGEDSPGSPFVSRVAQMSGFRDRWHDFNDGIKHILNSTTNFTRWKIAELPAMDTYASPQGGFVLIGDAAHAVQPFAGQGANMSIEDSACLAMLLSLIESKQQIPVALKLFDTVRVPRLARLRQIIQTNIATHGAANEADQAERDMAMRDYVAMKQSAIPGKDIQTSEYLEGMRWLILYDMIAETEKVWNDHMLPREQASL